MQTRGRGGGGCVVVVERGCGAYAWRAEGSSFKTQNCRPVVLRPTFSAGNARWQPAR